MLAKRMIIGYMFGITLLGFLIYINGFYIVPYFLGSLLIYSFLGFVIHRIYSTFKDTHKKTFLEFFIIFIYKISIYTSIIFLLLGYFVIHQFYIIPAQIPSHTLTNGEKTIVFQTMSHIAGEEFYKKIQENVLLRKKQGFTLYYEGVRPGSDENKALFDSALGVSLKPESYDVLANLYGITAQDNSMFLGLGSTPDKNIDLSIDEIMKIYKEKKSPTSGIEGANKLEKVYDIEEDILSQLDTLNQKELFLLRYFNGAIMSFIIKHENLRDYILSLTGKDDIFSVILDDRNEFLAKNIGESQDKKIIILYGLMHFEGVYNILQKQDPNWKITSTQYDRVIYPPSFQ